MRKRTAVNRKTNPYSQAYYEAELASFAVKERTVGSAGIEFDTRHGRIDGYMYRTYGELPPFPVLSIDGITWMSLSPMEVESHYIPIRRAEGQVVTGGLGLGYFVQRVLQKENVDKVVVYETNPDVVVLYIENFGLHPKLEIRTDNILDMKGETFDCAYIDIYEDVLSDAAPADMALLTNNNHIGEYRFWTMEQVMLEMIHKGYTDELSPEWVDDATEMGMHLLKLHDNDQRLQGNGSFWYKRFCDVGLL